MQKLKRKISLVLLICTFFTFNPTYAMAKVIKDTVKSTNTEPTFKEEKLEDYETERLESSIVKELSDKRDKNVKHFLKKDNSYEAVVYNEPIHYLENGKWKDIDNSLKEVQEEATKTEIIKEDEKSTTEDKKIENKDLTNDKGVKTDDLVNEKLESENEDKNKDNAKLKEIEEKSDKIINTETDKNDNLKNNDTDEKEEIKYEKVETKEDFLTNKQNDFKVKIAKKSTSDKLVTFERGNYSVRWSMENIKNSLAKIIPKDPQKLESDINHSVDNQIEKIKAKRKKEFNEQEQKNIIKENEKKKTLPKLSSEVRFPSIRENVDLQYTIKSQKLKEYIILNKRVDNPQFKFNLKVNNVVPKIEEDKSISFYDKNDKSKKIFDIDAPFMIDAQNVISEKIDVDLVENENGYTMILKPSKEWLNSKDRKYPVKIDPTENSSQGINDIQDTYVNSADPNKNRQKDLFNTIGYGKYTHTSRAFVKFNKLPKLSPSEMVTKATIELSLVTANKSSYQINAHEPTTDWSSSSITWNNKPGYNGSVVDYQMVKDKKKYSWDITKISKKWYTEGKNYGVMFKQKTEGSGKGVSEFVSSDNGSQYAAYRPLANIAYVNTSGLENYWTYHSQNIGRAGTAYVNDYTGNLVLVHDNILMNGNRMPITLKHVYNSNEVYNSDSDYVHKAEVKGYGNGFRLNLSQKIKSVNGKYRYTDEDGTNHYFKYDSSKKIYEDESGIDLTMTINPSNNMEKYVVEDKDKNKIIFLHNGFLYKLKDKNNNTTTLGYNGALLSTVTDATGRKVFLNYTSSKYLQSIEYPKGTTIASFAYSGGKISKITYKDGKYSLYGYNSKNNRLETVKNIDGYGMKYEYYGGSANRIYKIKQLAKDSSVGTTLKLKYGYNFTEFKNLDKSSTELSKKEVYQFNNQGNTVCIRDENGQAVYYKYSNDLNTNKLLLESKLQKTVINELKNHNVEKNDAWEVSNWTGSEGSGEYSSTYKHLGKRSLKISKTNKSSRHFYNQTLNLEKGKTYTFSAYMFTDRISEEESIGGVKNKGACIFVNYYDKDGKAHTEESKVITGSNNWFRNEVTFTLPKDASSDRVYIRAGIKEATGTAYFDCLQVEEGAVSNRYNLIENPKFKDGTYWERNGALISSDHIVYADKNDTTYPKNIDKDKKVFVVNGDVNKNKAIYQTINVSGKKGDTFALGGWAKGESVPLKSGRYFALDIGFERYDGGYDWKPISFNQDSYQWQYIMDRVIADNDYKSVKVYCLYYKNENKAYFDGIQLYKEQFGVSYQYDKDGKIISTKELAEQQSKFEYNDKNQLIKKTDPNGSNYRYEYDDNHNIKTAITGENVVYSFEYDEKGNPKKTKVGSGSLFIENSATYTDNGNYIKSMTDSRGNTINYNYDNAKGVLNSVTDAKENTTSYHYDGMDNLTSVEKSVSGKKVSNDYKYSDDKVSSIKHNGFEYKFNYDGFGRTSSVTVGNENKLLSKNIYDDSTGKVIKRQFGNNQYLDYGYDENHRINSVSYGNGDKKEKRFSYKYDGDGNLALKKDEINGTQHRYMYDLSGRIAKIFNSYGDITRYSYDKGNNLKTLSENLDGTKYVTNHNYDKDNNLLSTYYDRGIKENDKVEKFPLNNSFSGLKGTVPYTNNSVFEKDKESGRYVLGQYEGTKNLVNNSSFENDTVYWSIYDWSSSTGKGRIVSDGTDGKKSIELYDGDGKTEGKAPNAVAYQYVHFSSATTTDKRYTLSSFVKTIGNAQPRFSVICYDSNNKEINNSYVTKYNTIDKDKWERVKNTFSIPKGTKKVMVVLRGNINGKDKIRFDGIQFEERPFASTYTSSTSQGRRVLYNLNVAKTLGTMTTWFNTKGKGSNSSRIVMSNENDTGLLNTYISPDNKIHLAVRNSSGIFTNLITLSDSVSTNKWHFVATKWNLEGNTLKCKLFLDGKSIEKSITGFKDFSGGYTGIGSSVPGKYQLNGYLKNFNYSRDALSDTDINDLYKAGENNESSYSNITYNYDGLGRLTTRILDTGKSKFNISYGYEKGIKENTTTNLLKTVDNNGQKIGYIYDKNENIDTAIYSEGTSSEKRIKYYYDEAAQVIREDNAVLGKTITYEYDQGGNITLKKEYSYTKENESSLKNKTAQATFKYSYEDSNWKDKLTKVEITRNGKTETKVVTSDDIGNFKSYGGYNYEWEAGRILKSIKGNGKNVDFNYNDEGIRTSKSTADKVTDYHIINGKVTYEITTDFNSDAEDKIYYTYDGNNKLVSMNYNGKEYYYVRNGKSDIIGLIDGSGQNVVSYKYDTWGKLVSIDGSLKDTVGIKNPYRYKGYRYDTETGLYYLNSRYYNPEIGRFISADALAGDTGEILSHNVFSYCGNNPVNAIDENGYWWGWVKSAYNAVKKTVTHAYHYVKKAVRSAYNYVKRALTSRTTRRSSHSYTRRNTGVGGRRPSYIRQSRYSYGYYSTSSHRAYYRSYGRAVSFASKCATYVKKYKKPINLLLTLTEIGAGFLGLDTFFDVAHITYDLFTGNWGALALDGAALLIPGVSRGMLKALNKSEGILSSALRGGGNLGKVLDGPGCFTEDTLIYTKRGLIPIKEVTQKDEVYAYNEDTGKVELRKVKRTFVRESNELINVYANNTKIKATIEHPFYVEGKGFVEAKDLNVGDKLKNSNNKIETVTKLESNILNKTIKVYNFEVEGLHNYFVSKDKVLVHNNCWVEAGKRTGNVAWKKISKELVDKSTDVSSWSKGSFDSIQDSLARHFYKHGAEVRATSVEQYMRKAEAFMQNRRGAKKYPVNGAVEGVIRYVKNGKYIDLAPDGTIISFGKR